MSSLSRKGSLTMLSYVIIFQARKQLLTCGDWHLGLSVGSGWASLAEGSLSWRSVEYCRVEISFSKSKWDLGNMFSFTIFLWKWKSYPGVFSVFSGTPIGGRRGTELSRLWTVQFYFNLSDHFYIEFQVNCFMKKGFSKQEKRSVWKTTTEYWRNDLW